MEKFSELPEESRENLLIRHNKSLIGINEKLTRENTCLRDKIATGKCKADKSSQTRIDSLKAELTELKILLQEGSKKKSRIMMHFLERKGLVNEYRQWKTETYSPKKINTNESTH